MNTDDDATPPVTELRLHKLSRVLEVGFADGRQFRLPCEYLRVFSPSAEVRGHGGGEGKLVTGKEAVTITRIEGVGAYAVRLHFSDGHNTGLYTWPLLRRLGEQQAENWAGYQQRVAAAGAS